MPKLTKVLLLISVLVSTLVIISKSSKLRELQRSVLHSYSTAVHVVWGSRYICMYTGRSYVVRLGIIAIFNIRHAFNPSIVV